MDGSEIDGLHLLYPTSHSLNGFAIDRRESDQENRVDCFKLTATILDRAAKSTRWQHNESTSTLPMACETGQTTGDDNYEGVIKFTVVAE